MAKNEYQKRIWTVYRISDCTKSADLMQRKFCQNFVDAKEDWRLTNEIKQDVSEYSHPIELSMDFILKAARSKEVDIILCFSYRFLCRRTHELAYFANMLDLYDVEIWSVSEGKYTSFLHNHVDFI